MKKQIEDRLIIKPVNRGISNKLFLVVICITTLCIYLLYLLLSPNFWLLSFLMSFTGLFGYYIIGIRIFIIYGKIIFLTPEGCTIKIANFQKTYTWDQLKTKQWENYQGFRQPDEGHYYQGGLFLSPYRVRQKYRTYAHTYVNRFTLHPFVSVYIYFKQPDYNPPKRSLRSIACYEADEEVLRDTLNRWGVEVKDN